MNKTFPLKDAKSIEDIKAVLVALLALDDKKKHVVEVKLATLSLSAQQRKLYWKWLTIIGAELGDSKEYYHDYYKKKFLINIYKRDSDSFAEMLEAVNQVHLSGARVNAIILKREIVKMVSITDATVNQMVEFMQSIDMDASGLGIVIPRPDNHRVLEYRELKNES